MVRVKRRYILCEAVFPDHRLKQVGLNRHHVQQAILEALVTAHGDYCAAIHLRNLSVRYLNEATRILMIRVRRDGHKLVTTALPLITKIGKVHGFLKTIHLGGTIRSCQKFAVRYHRRELTRLLSATTDPEERREIQAKLRAGGEAVESMDCEESEDGSESSGG